MRQRLLNSNFVSSADLNTLYTTPIPYITEIPSPPGDFVPVDVFLDRKGYKVVGKIPNRPETNTEISIISFPSSYANLPYDWIRGHSDKEPWNKIQDLVLQQLSRDKIYHVWCNRMADNKWLMGYAPCINQRTTPAERWAFFSKNPQEHKLIGDLSTAIPESLGMQNTFKYIKQRHKLDDTRIEKINF
jgi:hypothetical protein